MLKVEPHPYQDAAIDRAIERGSLLIAFEMGLGKTVIAVAAVEELLGTGEVNTAVCVVPPSLKYQWAQQIAKLTDVPTREIKVKSDGEWQTLIVPDEEACVIIDGSPKQRAEQYALVKENRPDYVIMGYSNVVDDWDKVRRIKPECIILDEATAIKTFKAQRTRKIKRLTAPFRIALTGTPVENGKPEEIFCVDAETQILSDRGWLSYLELRAGDIVLTLNHDTGMSEWQPVQAVNVSTSGKREMVSMEHSSHSSLTTPDHRWPVLRPVESAHHRVGYRTAWATSKAFVFGDQVPLAAVCADLPDAPALKDSLVELVAWLYTEGHVRKLRNGTPGTAVIITQNTDGPHTHLIRAALKSEFGTESEGFPRLGSMGDSVPRWREDTDGKVSQFKLNTVAGAILLRHAPDKVPSHTFIKSLTGAQLDLFIDISMRADNNGTHCFSQKSRRAAEAFQFACILRGDSTSIRAGKRTWKDRDGNDYVMTTVRMRRQRYLSPGQSNRLGRKVIYDGIVWCPTTENQTWLARRRGTVYFTGNSIMQWVDDKVLGRFDLFDATYIVRNGFGGVERYKNLPVLHAKLSQVMVRKTSLDPDVAPYLPETSESNVEVVLDAKTKTAYKHIVKDLLDALAEAKPGDSGGFDLFSHYHGGESPNENTAQGKIMARMGALDMLLNHPDLVVLSGMAYEESARQREAGSEKKNWPGSKYCHSLWQSGVLDDVQATPKLDRLMEELEVILAQNVGNKVIVFSVNPEMLEIIHDALPEGVAVKYHGGMNAGQKAASAAKFGTDETCRVFLSSHAGAFGTDLYMANYLLNYDLAWSAGRQDQINKRHSRASSKFKHIYIRNFLTKGTTEPRKYSNLKYKRRVGNAITDGFGHDDKGRVENDIMTLTEYLQTTSV